MAVELAVAYVPIVPSFRGGVRTTQLEASKMGAVAAKSMAGEISQSSRSGHLAAAFSGVARAAKLALAPTALVAGGAAGWGFKLAAQAQQAEMAFTTLLGSTTKARSYLGELQKFAAKTPFEFPELRDAASRFIAVGVNAKRVIPIMTTLGDATSLMGTGADGIKRATTALTQMAQKHKVTAEDMMQLTEAGIPAWDGLAAVLHTNVADAMDQVSKGTVKADSVFQALETHAGPALTRLSGGMEKQSKTFAGMWSTLKDTLGQGLAKAMAPVLELATKALPGLTKVADVLVRMFGKALTGGIALAVRLFHNIGLAVSDFITTFRDPDITSNGIFGFIERGAVIARQAWDVIADVAPKIWHALSEQVGQAFQAVAETVARNWPGVRDTVVKVLGAIVTWIQTHWTGIKEVFAGVFDALRGGIKFVIDNKPVLIGILTAVGGAYALIAAQAVIAAAAQVAALAVPIAIGAAVAALVAGLIYAYQKVGWFRAAVDGAVKGVVAAGKWLADAWTKYSDDIWRVLQSIGRVTADIFGRIVAVVRTTITVISNVIKVGVATWNVAWRVVSTLVDFFNNRVKGPLLVGFQVMFAIARTQVQVAVTAIRTAWNVISAIVDFFNNRVKGPLMVAFQVMFTVIRGTVQVWVAAIRTAWHVVSAVVDFFNNHVKAPLTGAVSGLRDTVVHTFSDLVTRVKAIWGGISAVYNWFIDHLVAPLNRAAFALKDSIIGAFDKAVSGVKAAWDKLAGVVKTPINLVIGFYNTGIRRVWNNVISKIPGVHSLDPVAHLASGGLVPGVGNRDSVPAMLTPREFVFTNDAVSGWGLRLLEWMNRVKSPRGQTLDPSMFGIQKLAGGGQVRSLDEVLAWVRAQVGKPYVFPLSGPNAYDCSGFTSALVNEALGAANPYFRRHSSGTVGLDRALRPGLGDPKTGLSIGARPPYTLNRSGNFVGHTAATIGGVNAEATPPAVRMGGGSRGASSLPMHYFLPGFGGLSKADKGIVDALKSLASLHLPDLGGPPIGDLLTKMFKDLPKQVFDFLVHKMPSVIFDAVKDAVGGFLQKLNPLRFFGDGGTMYRPGPYVVGENGPEVRFGKPGTTIRPILPDWPPARSGPTGYGGPGVRDLHFHNPVAPTATMIAVGIRSAQLGMP